jgi:hypothetical protein
VRPGAAGVVEEGGDARPRSAICHPRRLTGSARSTASW